MSEELRAFGYLCPKCGKTVLGKRSVFTLAASDAAVSCDCGGSILRTEFDGNRFRLSVPCGLCGGTHTAVVPAERVLRDAAALSCPESGRFACFIGPEGTVEKQLLELEQRQEREQGRSENTAFLSEVVMYEVLSELRDIASRPGGVTCRCSSARYKMDIRSDAVDLVCADCGARLRIPAGTQEDLDNLCCQMKLVIPGGKREA